MVERQIAADNITNSTHGHLRAINQEATRLADMTNCVLTTLTTPFESSDIDALENEYIFAPTHIENFVEIVAGIVKPAAQQRGIALKTEIEENIPPVSGDADALIRLTLNLLRNAADCGGKNIVVRANKKVNKEIEDDGAGIAPELLPNVFERGVSGSGSTGLGLYVCRKIARAHNGEIKIENKSGGGVCVTVTLPILN